jgi:hypothetical protein
MQVDVISKDQFVQGVKDGKFDSGKILVLFKNIEDVREVVEKGVAFKQPGTLPQHLVLGQKLNWQCLSYQQRFL